ncbi:MAG: electron transfer flavoprotein subunit beta/FixA family protein [Bacteroidales bacterium]|nr:electron transfer flavoprotein subunit beta/FixA family protein [Bacteroidales bacterium]
MKILVCISNVPDTTTRVKFTEGNRNLDSTGVQWVINPWDELSLTRALELKDNASNGISSVTVAHVGPASSEPTIRKALAIGADDAVRVNCDASDSYSVALQLAEVVKEGGYDIVMCGIESSDHNGSSVGGMIAGLLDVPLVSAVSSLDLRGGEPLISREMDGGREIVTTSLPMVAVVQKGIAKEPRIAAMRGIMMARSKPVKVVEPVDTAALTEVIEYEIPAPRAACRFIDPENAAELIFLLQNEAKII